MTGPEVRVPGTTSGMGYPGRRSEGPGGRRVGTSHRRRCHPTVGHRSRRWSADVVKEEGGPDPVPFPFLSLSQSGLQDAGPGTP